MKLLIIITIVFALNAVGAIAGEPIVQKRGRGSVWITGGSSSASRYYDVNGTLKRFDTLRTELTATVFGVALNYGLTDDLELNADLPLNYLSITSKDRFPDRSIFAPGYLGLGATYQLSRGKVNASFSVMLKLPPGFHSGLYDDPKHPSFLSDGYLQALGTLNFGFNTKETWFKGYLGYNWRDEEPADEVVYGAEIGFTKVEGTGIFVRCNGVISASDVTRPVRAFYVGTSGLDGAPEILDGGRGTFWSIDRENYFTISGGAFVRIVGELHLSGAYTIRLFGNNALDIKGGYLGAGYNF